MILTVYSWLNVYIICRLVCTILKYAYKTKLFLKSTYLFSKHCAWDIARVMLLWRWPNINMINPSLVICLVSAEHTE